MSAVLTRRAALSGAVASVALVGGAAVAAMPIATLSAGSPTFRAALDAADAARTRFNNLPSSLERADAPRHAREVEELIAACQRADEAQPTTWREHVRLFEHMMDDGDSALSEDNADRLLAHARRLAKMEG